MAENKIYLALGEEAARGTKEATTVGFVPLKNPALPTLEFTESKREEFRGENWVKGQTTDLRMAKKWAGSLEIPFFTEAGGTFKAAIADIIEHCLGGINSAQNGATGQYVHMMYPHVDPFNTGAIGAKGITLNMNVNEGNTMKNWPFVGGRVKSITFTQETGQPLIMAVEMFGQLKGAVTAEIGSAQFPAENLRCDYNNLTVYTGTITRTGTGPNFTQFAFGSATQLKPDKIVVKIENGFEDSIRLSGLDYADKTRLNGQWKVSVEMTTDWESPGSGFNSITEFNNWIAAAADINFFFKWDTGTQAGTGDNHGLYIDVPVAHRMINGNPEYSLDKDPMITLKYEGRYSSTTAYTVGVMVKNTAATV